MGQLVTAFIRLECGGKLQFTTKVYRDLAGHDAALDDLQILSQAMVQPYSWEEIQSEGNKVDLDMIKMLSRLPIALANASVPLTDLYLDCFPLYAGFAQLLLHEKQTASELEWELQPVFQHLRVFSFGIETMDMAAPRHTPLPESDMSLMRAYLQAALASPQLMKAHLQFGAFGIHTDKASSTCNEALFRLGPLLNCCMSSKLRQLIIEAVDTKFDELQPLFSRLGQYMHRFELHGVRLLDGQWVPLLGAARQSSAQHWPEKHCRANFLKLMGGGFDCAYGGFAEDEDGTLGLIARHVCSSSSDE